MDTKQDFQITQAPKKSPEKPQQYLSTMSPKDKPWDLHRAEVDAVQLIYAQAQEFERYETRMGKCAGLLGFAWHINPETAECYLKLRTARFCRVRHCPVCQWRRTMLWTARFYQALPEILASFTKARWVFLTLTVRNCEVDDLRETLQHMGKAWKKFIQRKEFSKCQGWLRTTEVTRSSDGSAHPHYHVLMMVSPSWFKTNYTKQSRWVEIWGECLKVNYLPSVNIKAVKPSKDEDGTLEAAIAETLKYSVKPADMASDDIWFLELTRQVHKMRFMASGGALKNILKPAQETDQDLALLSEDNNEDNDEDSEKNQLEFEWRTCSKRYQKVES